MHFTLTKLSTGVIALALAPLTSIVMSQAATAGQTFVWSQGYNPQAMYSTNLGVCFLTSVQGKFEGGREKVEVYIKNGQWFLGGDSLQSGVAGQAYCAQWNELLVSSYSVTGPFPLSQGGSGERVFRYLDGFSEGNGFCFLSSVSGKFRGGGEEVGVNLNNNRQWILNIKSDQSGVSASAHCVSTPYSYTKLTSQLTAEQPLTVGLGSGHATCFLTGMRGKFQGGGESVTVYSSFGEWYIRASSYQTGVAGSARCYRK